MVPTFLGNDCGFGGSEIGYWRWLLEVASLGGTSGGSCSYLGVGTSSPTAWSDGRWRGEEGRGKEEKQKEEKQKEKQNAFFAIQSTHFPKLSLFAGRYLLSRTGSSCTPITRHTHAECTHMFFKRSPTCDLDVCTGRGFFLLKNCRLRHDHHNQCPNPHPSSKGYVAAPSYLWV